MDGMRERLLVLVARSIATYRPHILLRLEQWLRLRVAIEDLLGRCLWHVHGEG